MGPGALLSPSARAVADARADRHRGVAWWEMPLDMVIMLIAIYATIRLATRIYTVALMRGGARLSWRAALRLRHKPGAIT